MKRLSSSAIRARKGTRFASITAYDAPFASLIEAAGIDIILVGDSVGMVVYGDDSTVRVSIEDMQRHTAAVARATSTAHIIADLPFGSYEVSNDDAVRAAVRLVQAGATSVKLEGGARVAERIAAIVAAGIPVVAHIGVLPQTAALGRGFGRQRDTELLLADSTAVERAGAFAVVLEMVEATLAAELTEHLAIPTIGIGSGDVCDGQIAVLHDVLGLYPDSPPFARAFMSGRAIVSEALVAYRQAVNG